MGRASPGDADALTRIAFASKQYWGYPERWISRWSGFYALSGAGYELELEHLWVMPAWIGSGVGRLLFEHAMDRATSRGAKHVEIEADPNAEGFYLRMGARRTGENVYEIEGQRRALPRMVVELAG
jgi:GNAT superfamily N-acetyltransferase